RRHTSFSRDWSSDVCSSDLCVTERLASLSAWWAYGGLFALVFARVQAVYWLGRLTARGVRSRRWGQRLEGPRVRRAEELLNRYEIGRGSCRESGYVVARQWT